ncbi:MAG: cytochrome c [Ignavibacteria bacterium]|nr:cytochrome c [Ignavibacteria bacterium]
MSIKSIYSVFFFVMFMVIVAGIAGCGGGDSQAKKKSNAAGSEEQVAANTSGLSDFELENGIGPVKEKLTLGEIDLAKASKGEKIFNEKCSACHKLDEKYTGPPQRDVTSRRSPEYIVNMMLNPEEMLKKHPEAQKMLAQYMTQMPSQNLTKDDALAVLEYFRSVNKPK